MGASQQSDRRDLERRVHIDLPRVLPEEMGTTQYVEPSPTRRKAGMPAPS